MDRVTKGSWSKMTVQEIKLNSKKYCQKGSKRSKEKTNGNQIATWQT